MARCIRSKTPGEEAWYEYSTVRYLFFLTQSYSAPLCSNNNNNSATSSGDTSTTTTTHAHPLVLPALTHLSSAHYGTEYYCLLYFEDDVRYAFFLDLHYYLSIYDGPIYIIMFLFSSGLILMFYVDEPTRTLFGIYGQSSLSIIPGVLVPVHY